MASAFLRQMAGVRRILWMMNRVMNRKRARPQTQSRRFDWLPYLLISLGCALLGFAASNVLGVLDSLDGRLYDTGITSRAPRPPQTLAIVGLDGAFMAGRHVYLTPRAKLARLLDVLSQSRPSVIVLDVYLDGRVDDGPQGGDARLRAALGRCRQKGVPVLLSDRLELLDDTAQSGASNAGGLTAHGGAIPFFKEAATGSGSMEFPFDGDAIIRQMAATPPLEPMPLLAAQQHLARFGKTLPIPVVKRLKSEWTPVDFSAPPGRLEDKPGARISFVAAQTLLNQPFLAALLQDKAVFIGATYYRSNDFFSTPYRYQSASSTERRAMFGVELLAQATATVLRGAPRHSHQTRAVEWQLFGWTLAASLIVTFFALRAPWPGLAASLGFMAVAGAAAVLSARDAADSSFWGHHFWPASSFFITIPLAFMLGSALRQLKLARELRLVRDAFGAYVGEEVLQRMGDKMPELGGETRPIAVLFCDIMSFSALAERLSGNPAKLMRTLNTHFEPLIEVLHDRGAYTDNYVGDLVMALFGAPISSGNLGSDARNAVLAALDFARVVDERNQARREQGEEPIEVGIGVHCGEAVVGNLGTMGNKNTGRKIHYTALGDTVNIASRVESATRHYDTSILVTAEVVQECQADPLLAHLEWRFIEETLVKGREAPVKLFEPRLKTSSG